MKKKLVIVFLLLAVILFAGYKFLYKEHRDISSEEAAFTLSVQDLAREFTANDSLANAKYADKTIEVKGTVTSADLPSHTITIDQKLSAVLKDSILKNPPLHTQVTIKGRFVGYDDLLEEFKMDQVSILK